MTIHRNRKDGELYLIARVSPRHSLGSFYESQHFFTGLKRKLNESSWKMKDFIPIATC